MKIRTHLSVNLIIIISFIILALLNTVELMHFREVPVFQNGDLCFHWQRIMELIRSHQFFPYYDLNSFKDSGSAVMTMYPYLFLYPFAFIYNLTHSLIGVTSGFLILNTLAALLISYYSSLNFSRSKAVSYLFAVMYSLSFPLFINTVDSYAIGMNDAFIVMPLVIFGFMDWLQRRRWLMLAIGMTALVYSEVLITTFMIILLSLWALINVTRLQRQHVVNLVKAIIITMLSTSMFWLPAAHLYFNNRLLSIGTNHIRGVDFAQAFKTAFDIKWMVGQNNVFMMTSYAALGVVIGIVSFLYGHRLHKQIYVISILILLFISNLFPWPAFRGTALNTVQFPWRFYLVPQVILTYFLAEGIICGLFKVIRSPYRFSEILITLVVLVAGLQLANQYHYFVTLPQDTRGAVIDMNTNQMLTLNDVEYHDYYPQRANPMFHKIEHHDITLPNGRPVMKIQLYGHGKYVFSSRHQYRKLVIPVIRYRGTHYQVLYDGQHAKTENNHNNLLTIGHVTPGTHTLHVKVLPNDAIKIAKIMTIIGNLAYLWIILKWLMRKVQYHEA